MKTISITLFAIFAINISVFAQAKVKDQATINVPGLHCDLDKERLERTFFKMEGVLKYKIDVKRKTIFVSWLTDRTNIGTLKAEIANTGYDADNEKAEPTMRLKLPATCRVEQVVAPAKPAETKPAVVPAKPETKNTKPIITTEKPVIKTTKPAVTNTKPIVKTAKPATTNTVPKKN